MIQMIIWSVTFWFTESPTKVDIKVLNKIKDLSGFWEYIFQTNLEPQRRQFWSLKRDNFGVSDGTISGNYTGIIFPEDKEYNPSFSNIIAFYTPYFPEKLYQYNPDLRSIIFPEIWQFWDLKFGNLGPQIWHFWGFKIDNSWGRNVTIFANPNFQFCNPQVSVGFLYGLPTSFIWNWIVQIVEMPNHRLVAFALSSPSGFCQNRLALAPDRSNFESWHISHRHHQSEVCDLDGHQKCWNQAPCA